MKRISLVFGLMLLLAACGKPDGISNAEYAKYNELGAPKILYSCESSAATVSMLSDAQACLGITDVDKQIKCIERVQADLSKTKTRVNYSAGIGVNATYNRILTKAQTACDGKFKLLDSKP